MLYRSGVSLATDLFFFFFFYCEIKNEILDLTPPQETTYINELPSVVGTLPSLNHSFTLEKHFYIYSWIGIV